jgi:hypothetical protein
MNRRTADLWFVALAPLGFVHAGLRHTVESQMALHMLVQFPLLLASGWAMGRLRGPRHDVVDALDAHGLLGLSVVSCVSAFWMIPAALDMSLLHGPVRAAKYTSWLIAGVLLARSWPRVAETTAVFFAGNLAWMLATAGLLYRDADSRLCVSYLAADQVWAGSGLVALAVALGALALWRIAVLSSADGALTSSPTAAAPPRSSSSGPTAGRRPVRPCSRPRAATGRAAHRLRE